jgi:hypothetical protein
MIGNCCIGALLDGHGRIVWACLPRFDGEPVFHALVGAPPSDPAGGVFEIVLDGLKSARQQYVPNSAIVRTVLESGDGAIEIIDFAPRFKWRERNSGRRCWCGACAPCPAARVSASG